LLGGTVIFSYFSAVLKVLSASNPNTIARKPMKTSLTNDDAENPINSIATPIVKKVTVHDPILSEVTFGARRFKTASKDGLGFKGRRRGHWA
jgi:hypothetical protein